MKSKDKISRTDKHLQKLSLSIGNFIRYWGFRRIHGAIWTQLYLSRTPLSCTELTLKLGLSKALISPALDELCHYRLIFEAPAPNEKTKLYEASLEINEVIKHILKEREARMLQQIAQDFSAVKNDRLKSDEPKSDDINMDRLNSLEEMISSANLMLELMIEEKDLLNLPLDLKP